MENELVILRRTTALAPLPQITKKDYVKVRDAVWRFLLAGGVKYLPVNVEDLFEKLNCTLVSYQDVKEELSPFIKENYFSDQTDSFTIFYKGKTMVVYNDDVPITRLRYSLSHELGHIVLGHTENSESNEAQAEMFAARLLMPTCVLSACKVESAEEISLLCDVSLKAAEIRFKRLQTLSSRNSYLKSPLERELLSSFEDFIQGYLKYQNRK